jgi:hypothetical protein
VLTHSSLARSDSVLGRSLRVHLDDARTKLAEHIHEVGLRGHDALVVFVNHGQFVDVGAEEFDTGGVAAHELHGSPVCLACYLLKGEPHEVLQLLWQAVATIHRDTAVILAHLRSRAARAAVAQQREVFTRRQVKAALLQRGGLLRIHVKGAELDKVIPGAALTELRIGFVFETSRDGRNGPIFFHDLELALLIVRADDAKAGLAFEDVPRRSL